MSKLFDDPEFENESREPVVSDWDIHGFFRQYFWLSNFYPCAIASCFDELPIKDGGLIRFGEIGSTYPSSENIYQAGKVDQTDTLPRLKRVGF